MKHIKSLLLSLLLCTGISTLADNYVYLNVTKTDGESHFTVSEIDKITFDQTNMVLHMTNGEKSTLPLAQLQKMFFSKESTGIATVSKSQSVFTSEGSLLHVKVGKGEIVTLYNIKGEQLMQADHDTTIDTKNLPNGVYIVKTGNQTRKFIAK